MSRAESATPACSPGEPYRELVEHGPAVTYVAEFGTKGDWTYVSPQIEEWLGYPREEWLRDPGLWYRSLHPEDRDVAMGAERHCQETGDSLSCEYRMIASDGREVWVRDQASLVASGDGEPSGMRGVMLDITELKRSESELAASRARNAAVLTEQVERQAAVADLGQRALEGLTLDELMRFSTEIVAEQLELDFCQVWKHLPNGGFQLVAGRGWDEKLIGQLELPGDAPSQPGFMVRTGSPVIVEDFADEQRFDPPGPLSDLGVTSGVGVAVPGPGRPFGALGGHTRDRRQFSSSDLSFLQAVANILGTAIDRHLTEQEMRHRALHDELTGLPNRALLLELVRNAMTRARRGGGPVAVFFIDIDGFKLVNDSFGHDLGDQLLVAIGERLRGVLRESDQLARLGGDEFVALCETLQSEEDATWLAERLVSSLERPFELAGGLHFVSASVGIALSRGEDKDPVALLQEADTAMYAAKKRGFARHAIFDESMLSAQRARSRLERVLRGAAERGELRVYYQPIVSLPDERIVAVEALARWEHPGLGFVSPAEFIPIAEESGLIVQVGAWVMREACRQAAAWRQALGDSAPRLCVNLSSRQVQEPDLAEFVASTLAESGLDPSLLTLEITETLLIEEEGAGAAKVAGLRELGVGLALDDFGTGFSSLSYLQRFDVDEIKVDRSFVRNLPALPEALAIVEAIIGLARGLDVRVIAEGVETPEQLAVLSGLGVHTAQGFLLGRPMPADAATERLAAATSLAVLP